MSKKQFYLILTISVLCFILAVTPKPPPPKHTMERTSTAMTTTHKKQHLLKKVALDQNKPQNKAPSLPNKDGVVKPVITMTVEQVEIPLDDQP
ncbi:StcA family protein [Streptococcus dysgalactiae subsp. equisimilis]|uniref:StcA family protein n=1 Tax=Streptococcus dysgalactiae TaxID=1334 RepID=UPI001F135694|nr:StcA family protein [Streptococcus dysgalactiae]MCL6221817.1 StcA family protein [Streptococcus dysgalactiae subsp. equisimilis]UMY68575.1 StcA family protein [Streptococcus dysgalactiae subsp. equisimilis]